MNAKPNSSTKRQHQVLVQAAAKRGIELAELRKTVGGSLRALSAADASRWIKLYSGRDLANPPGGKPFPYKRRKPSRDREGAGSRPTPRMITADHIEQIGRLMLRYFDNNVSAASAWFEKNWKCKEPSELGTTERAGEVIKVLKEMVNRKIRAATGMERSVPECEGAK